MIFIRFIRQVILLGLLTTLVSCSVLAPVPIDSQKKYVLTKLPQNIPQRRTRSSIILVATPEATPFYNTTGMVYTTHEYQLAYFAQNEWAETPPQMLQSLLVQTLQNTHYFRAVVTPPFAGRYDYALNTQILMLQQDFTHHQARLRLILRVQLSRATTGQIIASRQITVIRYIHHGSPYAGVIAANQAVADALRQIARMCVR